jgi:hypothetical protein
MACSIQESYIFCKKRILGGCTLVAPSWAHKFSNQKSTSAHKTHPQKKNLFWNNSTATAVSKTKKKLKIKKQLHIRLMQHTLTQPSLFLHLAASPASSFPPIHRSSLCWCYWSLVGLGDWRRRQCQWSGTCRGFLWAFPHHCSQYPASLLVGAW